MLDLATPPPSIMSKCARKLYELIPDCGRRNLERSSRSGLLGHESCMRRSRSRRTSRSRARSSRCESWSRKSGRSNGMAGAFACRIVVGQKPRRLSLRGFSLPQSGPAMSSAGSELLMPLQCKSPMLLLLFFFEALTIQWIAMRMCLLQCGWAGCAGIGNSSRAPCCGSVHLMMQRLAFFGSPVHASLLGWFA